MPGPQYVSTVVVRVDGSALSPHLAPQLEEVVVEDSRNVAGMFLLRFRDPDHSVLVDLGVRMGSTVTVSVETEELDATLITGEVTAIEGEMDADGTFAVVRGLDALHRLHRGRRSVAYLNKTSSDIVREVARSCGISLGAVAATSHVHESLSQVNTTDGELLLRLARDEGRDLAVVDGKLTFDVRTRASTAPRGSLGQPESDPLVLTGGTDLLRFRATITSAGQAEKVQVRGWDDKTARAVVVTEEPTVHNAVVTLDRREVVSGARGTTHVLTDTPHRSVSAASAVARAVASDMADGHVEFEGLVHGNPFLRAGTAITLQDIGKPFEGSYSITSTRHTYGPATGYRTLITVSGRQDRSLYGLAQSGRSTSSRIPGVVSGVVTDVKDPEVRGRVRLTFPWLDDGGGGSGPAYVSSWARVVQLGAGPGKGGTGDTPRGVLVLPEVGDEVLVAFEQGDPDSPYVIGGLFNGTTTLPQGQVRTVSESGEVDCRSVTSRLGHALELVDKHDEPGVRLVTGDGACALQLDQARTQVVVSSDGTVMITGAKGITLDAGAEGDVTISGRKVTLTAAQGATVDGGAGPVEVTSSAPVSVKSGARTSVTGPQLELKATAMAELSGGGILNVSAALVKIN